MPDLRRICVYCGSNPGRDGGYRGSAERLAGLLAARGIGVVYGGGAVGMMGALADAMLAAGGRVIGVIPQALVDREICHRGLTVSELEESIEVLTWTQLGLHAKPCALLGVQGFYAPLRRASERDRALVGARDVEVGGAPGPLS